MTIDTVVGPATVLHRLAVGVECVDAVTRQPVLTSIRVGRETQPRQLGRRFDPRWPCLDFEAAGTARFKQRLVPTLPTDVVVRIDDPHRRFVPRRFIVHPWTPADIGDPPTGPYIPVRYRVLRAWLWPGSAYPLPRGTTAIRGRVTQNDVRVPWARVRADGPTNATVGWAHADDRGEFVLVITKADQNPLQSTVAVNLFVTAPEGPPLTPTPTPPPDRCADLVIEDVPRSPAPPTPAVLDSAQLRGTAVPDGYVEWRAAPPIIDVLVGAELVLTEDIDFISPP